MLDDVKANEQLYSLNTSKDSMFFGTFDPKSSDILNQIFIALTINFISI